MADRRPDSKDDKKDDKTSQEDFIRGLKLKPKERAQLNSSAKAALEARGKETDGIIQDAKGDLEDEQDGEGSKRDGEKKK